ncbi:MAG: hypothetical protein WBD13_20340 [Burkholderiaceae bacterium]
MFDKSPKSVLYISARGLLAVEFDGNKPVSLEAFLSDDEARDGDLPRAPSTGQFEQWLVQRKHYRFEILVDSVGELQHTEIMPRLGWGDRKALLKRKTKQQFRDNEFTTVILKNEKIDGKPRLSALMMALRDENQLIPWFNLLLKYQARVDSLASPALLTERVVQMFRPGGSGLLVSLNPAGLRQTIVVGGRVKFSRLAMLKEDSSVEIQAEITRTLQYLLMSQRLSRDDIRDGSFEVWMIDTGFKDQIGLADSIVIDQGATITVRIVDPTQLNLPILAGQTGLSLWLQVPGRKAITDYRSARLSRFARVDRVRKRLWTLSSATAVMGMVAALGIGYAIDTYLPDTSAKKRLFAIHQREANELDLALSRFSVSVDEIRATVVNAIAIEGRSVSPWAMLRAVGNAVSDDPGIQIDRLAWDPDDLVDGAAGAAPSDLSPLTTDSSSRSSGPMTRISLNGTVDPSWSKERANNEVSAMAKRLQSQCACTEPRVQLPYDPSPSVAISHDYIGDAARRPSFEIVVLSPPGSPVRVSSGEL